MTGRRVAAAVLALAAAAVSFAVLTAQPVIRLASPIVIPFTEVSKHIVLEATVRGRPLAFVFDTGDKLAIIGMDRARALGLALGAPVRVMGVGSGSLQASFVRDASFGLTSFPGFSQPLSLAMPLRDLAERMGHDFDGILGADFIRAFVVEIDYQTRTMTLHDRSGFHYAGPGLVIPMRLNAGGHPIVDAEVTPIGGRPITGTFTFDMGAGAALTLHSPFVAAHALPGPGVKTVRSMGSGGAGGASAGVKGRVAALRLGGFELRNLPATFSQDAAGAFAAADVAGNIGAGAITRFRVFLDYGRRRIILERAATFDDPFDAAASGLALRALGEDLRTFRVDEVLRDSPGSDAGLLPGDVITSMDGRAASSLSLAAINEAFERAQPRRLTVRRGDREITVTLRPRVLV